MNTCTQFKYLAIVYIAWRIKGRSRIISWSRCRHFRLDYGFKRSQLILLGNGRPDINLLWQLSSASFLSSYIFSTFIFILRWIKSVKMKDVKMRWLSDIRSRTSVTVLTIFSFLSLLHASSFILGLCVFKYVYFVSYYMRLLCLFWWGKIALSDKLLTVSLLRNPPLMYSGVCFCYFFYKYFSAITVLSMLSLIFIQKASMSPAAPYFYGVIHNTILLPCYSIL